MSNKVVVMEVVLPHLDAEAIEEQYEAFKDEVPLHAFLGQLSNEVSVTGIYLDEEEDEVLETQKGYIVRTRISDQEWVKMTSDRFNFEGEGGEAV